MWPEQFKISTFNLFMVQPHGEIKFTEVKGSFAAVLNEGRILLAVRRWYV